MNNKKVIVALDGITQEKALKIAKSLSGLVWGFKINDLLYENISIIRKLKKYGNVFADAKFHDIPNTVANSVRKLSDQGVDIITVHASGGIEMMKAAKKNSGKSKIIAVTVLTSSKLNFPTEVLRLTKKTIEAGLYGIVCSGHELKSIVRIEGIKGHLKIVPGIRPSWYKEKDDQVRKMTPDEAIRLGADYLVIGRPLTKSKNILKTLQNI